MMKMVIVIIIIIIMVLITLVPLGCMARKGGRLCIDRTPALLKADL